MKSLSDRQAVIAMNQAGQSIRKISRILKISRKTIRRYSLRKGPLQVQKTSSMNPWRRWSVSCFSALRAIAVLVQKELGSMAIGCPIPV